MTPFSLQFHFCLSLLFFCFAPAHAQMLDETALQKETALQAKVSLEIIKKPLSELLQLLQEQNGVKLSYAPDSPAKTVRVTARFNGMTLADVLSALSRIYGVQWQQVEGSYVMHRFPQDDLHLRLFHHRGTSGLYDKNDLANEKQETSDFVTQIYDSLPENSWKTPDGVAFSALPTTLQNAMRMRVLENNVLAFATQVRHEEQAADADLELRLGSISPNVPALLPPLRSQFSPQSLRFIKPGWTLYTGKGELVISIFPEVHGPSPIENALQAERLQWEKEATEKRNKATNKAGAKPAR